MTTRFDLTRNLCGYIARAQKLELPQHVVAKAKQHILDTFAAMVSGSMLKPGKLIIGYVQSQGGTAESQVIGSSIVTTAGLAALANGTLAHTDETDDSHAASATHPGCAVVPAAFAMAERGGLDGKSFLKAVVVGYDVGCRVGRALVPDFLSRRGHSSRSIGGTFGAAAAAACLARFDADHISWALSYAAQQACGIGSYIRADNHAEKAVVLGGIPARSGVTAATLVEAGFSGAADPFQGERNFLQAYSPAPSPAELVQGLGSHFEITETSIKKFCVGSPIQASLEGLLQLIGEHQLEAHDVQRLVVRLPAARARTVDDRSMPDINLQYILAVTLLDGGLTFAAAHSPERMKDSRVTDLKSRISLVADPDLVSRDLPRQAILEITTGSGARLTKHVMAYCGTPENPMTNEEVENKARELLAPVIGRQKSDRLIDIIGNLEQIGDLRAFRSLLAA